MPHRVSLQLRVNIGRVLFWSKEHSWLRCSLCFRTKALVLELLAAVCLVRGGHDIILAAFDNFKEVCALLSVMLVHVTAKGGMLGPPDISNDYLHNPLVLTALPAMSRTWHAKYLEGPEVPCPRARAIIKGATQLYRWMLVENDKGSRCNHLRRAPLSEW